MNDTEFKTTFKDLTGHMPLAWQERLFCDVVKNKIPAVIDLPTGLGKTMVMAIWLIAWSENKQLPRRLIYVVDRRTVVDQATDIAKKLKDSAPRVLNRLENVSVSTLRGQLADNREWTRDLSRPAIIIGTVDLIGSGLLFSGYRSSFKQRPLQAGLLGQDSLLVLDEAHLSKPFEKLVKSITQFQRNQGSPMQVIRMSATSGVSTESKSTFTLLFDANGNLTDQDANDTIVSERFGAKKRLSVSTLGENDDRSEKLAGAAVELAQNPNLIGKRIVVFVRKPEDAMDIAGAIRKYKSTKTKQRPYVDSVEVLTGTMRGLERDKLVEKPVFKDRWLDGQLAPSDPTNEQPVFLISTSAGEVGFDLNADHLVGDAAPLDSWIQRLGRVNRRGKGIAIVHIFVESTAKKQTKVVDPDKHTIASASAKAIEALKQLSETEPLDSDKCPGPVFDASPRALRALPKPDKALSPPPTMVELTDILLDAWSMTSITQPLPGRPEVGPWLRGIDEELPQTTIAWRAELDEPGFADLDYDEIAEWFDTHRILTHETLSVPTNVAAMWLTDRWSKLDDKLKSEVGKRPIIVDRSGLKLVPVREVVDQIARKNTDSMRYADIILPASFGGIERDIGLLDAAAPKKPEDPANADEQTQLDHAKARLIAPDVADLASGLKRQRRIITKTEGGEPEHRIIGGGTAPTKPARFVVALESDDDRTVRLVSRIPKGEKPEYGSKKQPLRRHVGAVRMAVDDILARLSLPEDLKLAAQLAADWHDHGKNRERWQRTIGGTATVGTTEWMQQKELEGDGEHQCLGKSGGQMKRDSRGYRHEFGSLREFSDAFSAGKLLDNAGKPIGRDVFDLAMHLIAVHHGRGRPHFPKGGFDPECESRSDEIHTEAIRRFARLQRKYGWWRLAWLENLLRCPDQLASADDEVTDIDEFEGDE